MEFASVESAPVQRPPSRLTFFEILSADDDMLHVVTEEYLVKGITAGEGSYRAVSGERVTAHASTASSGRRCSACRAAVGRLRTAPPRQPAASRRDGHHRRCHARSLIASLAGLLTSHPQPGRRAPIVANARAELTGRSALPSGPNRASATDARAGRGQR
jgi:hypothetical protein